jgi:hypothetical protein
VDWERSFAIISLSFDRVSLNGISTILYTQNARTRVQILTCTSPPRAVIHNLRLGAKGCVGLAQVGGLICQLDDEAALESNGGGGEKTLLFIRALPQSAAANASFSRFRTPKLAPSRHLRAVRIETYPRRRDCPDICHGVTDVLAMAEPPRPDPTCPFRMWCIWNQRSCTCRHTLQT